MAVFWADEPDAEIWPLAQSCLSLAAVVLVSVLSEPHAASASALTSARPAMVLCRWSFTCGVPSGNWNPSQG